MSDLDGRRALRYLWSGGLRELDDETLGLLREACREETARRFVRNGNHARWDPKPGDVLNELGRHRFRRNVISCKEAKRRAGVDTMKPGEGVCRLEMLCVTHVHWLADTLSAGVQETACSLYKWKQWSKDAIVLNVAEKTCEADVW